MTWRCAVAGLAGTLVLSTAVAGQSPAIDRDALLADFERLASDRMAGRAMGTEGSARARALIVERFAAVGVEPLDGGYEQPFDVHRFGRRVPRAGVNVVGRIVGTTHPDEVIVVSAHYDHLGTRRGVVYNGANDNASGTAALIAVGAHFAAAPPRHTLLLVAFDGEELGLLGAHAFVEAPPVPRDAIRLNLNADMLARDPSRTLWVAGTHRFPELEPVVRAAAGTAPVTVRLGHDDPAGPDANWMPLSDQYAFAEAGIPALYIGVDDEAEHHEPTDDFETVDPAFYLDVVEALIRLVEAFDAYSFSSAPSSSGAREAISSKSSRSVP